MAVAAAAGGLVGLLNFELSPQGPLLGTLYYY